MRFFVTGTAGFIGFHLARRLLGDGHSVTGYDGLTPYYDVALKRRRHELLGGFDAFLPHVGLLEDAAALRQAAEAAEPDIIVHLAAQAGVRYSLEQPQSYASANLAGSFNLLEVARDLRPRHFLLASTSAVYGANEAMPFSERDAADHPLSVYAATKKAMEVLSHAHAHAWRVPTTCFRFFTVYGPWGRPDMALFKFVSAILEGRPIDVYGDGTARRDFTYVDDLVEAVVRLVDCIPQEGRPVGPRDTLSPAAPWRVVNIAGGQPVDLAAFIAVVERQLGRTAEKRGLADQAGDLRTTFADHRLLEDLTGYRPATPLEAGVAAFVNWYLAARV
jgi:UDP-glucuronate 4-epimerase